MTLSYRGASQNDRPLSAVRIGLALLFLFAFGAARTFAQDDKKKDEPAKKEDAAKKVDSAPAPAEKPAQPTKSFLRFCWDASPVFFVIMSLISIYLGASVITCFRKLRLSSVLPTDVVQNVDALLAEKKYKEAYESIKAQPSLIARSVSTGVERLSQGYERAEGSMMVVVDDGKMELEHTIAPMATIGTVGPLMGLLGTVLGMVAAFEEIGRGAQPRPTELAQSIGLALIATLEGLIVAIPAVFFYGYFRNRLARLMFEVETLADTLLFKFSGALKKP